MPETRRQICPRNHLVLGSVMFRPYKLHDSRRELRHKDLRKNWVGLSQRLLTLSYTPLLYFSRVPKSKTPNVTSRDRLLRVS
jgi:hypothetical protein